MTRGLIHKELPPVSFPKQRNVALLRGVFREHVSDEEEWRNDSGQFRGYGNELWEFDDDGLMLRREASTNDVAIAESDLTFFWPVPGPRSADHPGIPDVE